jgi:Ca2+-binding RTX toxin-like protein
VRHRLLIPLILVAAGAVPVPASLGKGSATDPVVVTPIPPDLRFGGPGGIGIHGSVEADDVSVEIDPATGRYLVREPDGAVPSPFSTSCESVDAATVSCEYLGPQVGLRMLAGDDSLSVGDTVTGSIAGTTNAGADRIILPRDYPGRLFVRAGPGADVLAGGIGNDRLVGQDGPDRLRGRAGPDRIYGERGVDRASGGSGDDRLLMKQNDRDKSIDCGSGDDFALIDGRLDPEPRDCERIKAKPAR